MDKLFCLLEFCAIKVVVTNAPWSLSICHGGNVSCQHSLNMASKEEVENESKSIPRKLSNNLIPSSFFTLGRKAKKKTITYNKSCTDLHTLVKVDNLRPDSGYDDSFVGGLSGSANPLPSVRKMSEPGPSVTDDQRTKKYREDGLNKINELIQTERNYINDLTHITSFHAYGDKSKKVPTPAGIEPMPLELASGKDKIAFGNSLGLLDFHQRCILTELERSIDEVGRIERLFARRKDDMKDKYGRFCINTPKAEVIVSDFEDYFEMVRCALDLNQPMSSLIMTPVQRVTRYQLLLGDAAKCFEKAGDVTLSLSLRRAQALANEVCEHANDMMIAGRITGFNGEITRQGLLLFKGDVTCFKKRSYVIKKPKPRDCMLFVFRESIIVCEKLPSLFPSTSNSVIPPTIQMKYWVGFQMNAVTAKHVQSDMQCTFELARTDKDKGRMSRQNSKSEEEKPEESEILVKCKDEETKMNWLKLINDQIALLSDFALALSNPKAAASGF